MSRSAGSFNSAWSRLRGSAQPTPELNGEWRKAHERLAASMEDRELLVAEGSGHMITETEPEIIVRAVSASPGRMR